MTVHRRLLRLVRHSAVYGFGSVASKLLAIALLPLYLRYLEPRSYGVADAVLIIDLFAAAIFRLGLQNAMMRFYYDAGEGEEGLAASRRVVRTTLAVTLASTGVGVLVLGAFATPLATFFLGDPELSRYIWVAAFGMWTTVLYSTVTATYRLQQRPGAFVRLSLANVALTGMLTVLFVTQFGWGAIGLLLGTFLASFLLIPVAAFGQRSLVRPTWHRELVRPMLRFALPTVPMAMAIQGLALIDRTALARLATLEDVGLYAVANRVAQVVMLVVVALQMSWQPFAYSIRDDEEARRTYALVASWFAATMGWLVAAIALLADPVLRVLVPAGYHPSIDAVPLLAMAAAVYGAYFLVGIGTGRVKRTGFHVYVAGAAVMVSLAANALLVGVLELGFRGAAGAALVANAALALGMLLRGQAVFRVPYERRRILTATLLAVLAVGAAFLLPRGTDAAAVVPRVALALAWPLLLVGCGFLDRDERRILRRLGRLARDHVRHRRELRAGRDLGPDPARAPIFIVGAPRSGSTLLYQLLVERFDLGYLANAHCAQHAAPSLLERRRRPLEGRPPLPLESSHGATSQPWEPSECGEYWYRFVPREPHELHEDDVDERMAGGIRAAVRALRDAFDRPVAFKNLYCTLRLPALRRALPEATYLHVRRDLQDVGRSLLRARADVGGDVREWWSARPAACADAGALAPEQQVVEQVLAIDAVVEREAATLAPGRLLEVSYEQLCDDPAATLDAIGSFLRAAGVDLRERPGAALPARIQRVARPLEDEQLERRLASYVAARTPRVGSHR